MSATLQKRGPLHRSPNPTRFEHDLSEEGRIVIQYGLAVWSYDLLRGELAAHLYEAVRDILSRTTTQE